MQIVERWGPVVSTIGPKVGHQSGKGCTLLKRAQEKNRSESSCDLPFLSVPTQGLECYQKRNGTGKGILVVASKYWEAALPLFP